MFTHHRISQPSCNGQLGALAGRLLVALLIAATLVGGLGASTPGPAVAQKAPMWAYVYVGDYTADSLRPMTATNTTPLAS